MVTGTVHSRGISTRIITIKVVLVWAPVILATLTRDSRQDTIKVIMATSSMTTVAAATAVVEDEAAASTAVMDEEAAPTSTEATRITRTPIHTTNMGKTLQRSRAWVAKAPIRTNTDATSQLKRRNPKL
jgi:hypothetical protein